ncbi:MAG: hypothetical protein Q7J44_21855 [Pseudotabrizicola sp.]|uniref:hypothetical protein n=1 Tax=Pseudotabrizicola sp. TaxID=2939647 RepID=UPI00272424BD|nr:hypothetical protein [Pseudotabrizicola sp.]MDO9641181.1 hypothetical protein [Pseudotabrizicola sp.]
MNYSKKAAVDAKFTSERKNTHDAPEEPGQWPQPDGKSNKYRGGIPKRPVPAVHWAEVDVYGGKAKNQPRGQKCHDRMANRHPLRQTARTCSVA